MQDKFVNLGNWLSSLVDKYLSDAEGKEEAKSTLSTYFQSEENYLNVYFSLIPGMVSVEKPRQVVTKLRSLKEQEPRREAIVAAIQKAKFLKVVIDTFLAVPENELDDIVRKFSLYINLFTDMYMAQK